MPKQVTTLGTALFSYKYRLTNCGNVHVFFLGWGGLAIS